MARIILTPAAEDDLADIWSYIAADNPTAVDKLLADIDTPLHPHVERVQEIGKETHAAADLDPPFVLLSAMPAGGQRVLGERQTGDGFPRVVDTQIAHFEEHLFEHDVPAAGCHLVACPPVRKS